MAYDQKTDKIRPEDSVKPSDTYLEHIGDLYTNYYKFKTNRDGSNLKQFQGKNFDQYLQISRELFWTSMITKSDDLAELDLDFALPFVRKEVLDYLGRIVSMNINPKLMGDNLGIFGINVLQAMHKKWRLKSKDKVEKFWQVLYGIVNGTVCMYVGYNGEEKEFEFLRSYNPENRAYAKEKKKIKRWDDAFSEIVPLEDIYLEKMWERNIQKQGKVIRRQEMLFSDFQKEFGHYADSRHVVPGNLIDEESIFFKLLGGTTIGTTEKVQVLTETDLANNTKKVAANGIWLNRLGRDTVSPMPTKHLMQPYVWSINEPIDEKFAYGLSTPFKLKDPHKILNTSYTMMVERELRAIDPPILTSDFEAPELIFGQNKVIPVNDVAAYKEMNISEPSNQFFTMQNSLQGLMTAFGQGGFSQVAPSRQPKSAREVIALENLKQQSLGNALVMYYDLVYQELILLLKTMLQFYPTGKYSANKAGLIRSFTVPNFPLTQGGVGNMEVRFVEEPQNGLALHFEAVNKSIESGKTTEIIEVPISMLVDLEFYIDDIKLEPEKSSELEKAQWNESVLGPLVNLWIPMGLADPAKAFIRWAEKNEEHPASFASDQQLSGVVSSWNKQYRLPEMPSGPQQRNMMQIDTGVMNGGQSAGGFPELAVE